MKKEYLEALVKASKTDHNSRVILKMILAGKPLQGGKSVSIPTSEAR